MKFGLSAIQKKKNVAPEDKGILGYGDVYTWTAIDADSKLAISWLVGRRDYDYAEAFISDLASRLSERVQLTSDGYGCYINAVEKVFGGAIDYAMLVDDGNVQKRYRPAPFVGAEITLNRVYWVNGNLSLIGGGSKINIAKLRDALPFIEKTLATVKNIHDFQNSLKIVQHQEQLKRYFLIAPGFNGVFDLGEFASEKEARESEYCWSMSARSDNPESLHVVNQAVAHELMRQLKLKLSHYDNSSFKQ